MNPDLFGRAVEAAAITDMKRWAEDYAGPSEWAAASDGVRARWAAQVEAALVYLASMVEESS